MQPRDAADVAEAVAQARAAGTRLSLRGGGSKAGIGRATACPVLDLSALTGIVDYDPAELVLTLRPGTPLAEVEALVERQGQMLAFEPFDHGPVFGRPAGAATIGGVIAAGVAGSRRLTAGGVRDHLLGFHAVNGRGEAFVAGAKVVKNVTGYDLPKLACGSWGRLFAMTQVTLKVLPRGRTQVSIGVEGLAPAAACAAMAAVLGSAANVQAAAHRPAGANGPALTVVRLEGFSPSVAARAATVAAMWRELRPRTPADSEATRFWQDLRDLAPLRCVAPTPPRHSGEGRNPVASQAPISDPGTQLGSGLRRNDDGGKQLKPGNLWRINTRPSAGPDIIAALAPDRWLFDWAGGLTWLIADDARAVRAVAEAAGGHAMLVRGDDALRRATPALHPLAAPVAALEARIRASFDPDGVFETGRFTHAD